MSSLSVAAEANLSSGWRGSAPPLCVVGPCQPVVAESYLWPAMLLCVVVVVGVVFSDRHGQDGGEEGWKLGLVGEGKRKTLLTRKS